MRKTSTLLLSLATFLSGTAALAQEQHCGTTQAHAALLARDPHLAEREAAAEDELQHRLALRDDNDSVRVVPVVFHILHFRGVENISDAQVHDEMEVLNRDYALLNTDLANACCGFQDIAGTGHIEFRLAQLDPYGRCTNGIDRIETLRTFEANDTSKLSPWFRERYLNIWVIATMRDPDVAGYAYYPPDMEGAHSLADGIVVLHNSVGRIGTGSEARSRTLTHEVGHWLNLRHVWGPTNDPGISCGDDLVEDTPTTKGYDNCPTPEQSKVCDPDVYENYQNYMEYSGCRLMFTEGQVARMRAAIASPVSGRNNLWTATNLLATGTEDGHLAQCAPQADFYSYIISADLSHAYPLACAGSSIQFHDNSGVASPTGWQWEFPGGTPATSTEQHPLVTYAQEGYYSATLTVTNAFGSSSITKQGVAFISPGWPEVNGLLQEPFNDQAAADRWTVLNLEHNQTSWTWTDGAGHNTPGCYRMNGSQTVDFSDPIGSLDHDRDELITPTMDLSHLTDGTLSFWFAAATEASDISDVDENLKVYSSTDCGSTWQLRKTIAHADIVTGGTSASGYSPIPGDWTQVSVPIIGPMQEERVRFKFLYTSSLFSNDLFLDDVNIEGTVGIGEHAGAGAFLRLIPNPAHDRVTVGLEAPSGGTLSLVDATGRVALVQAVKAGTQRMELDLASSGLRSGVYLVRFDHAEGREVERLVVR